MRMNQRDYIIINIELTFNEIRAPILETEIQGKLRYSYISTIYSRYIINSYLL